MDCLLAAVFAARMGGVAIDERMIHPPPELDGRPRSYAEKGVFGSSYRYHIETENFTVQWTDGSLSRERAADIADSLEAAWTALVTEGGWTPPVSSDRYLLWVILDPTLEGSGYTTEYEADEFPAGYPVTYLHPTYYQDEYPDFALSVAAHEFGHMLQYAVADWEPGNGNTWYWEATAEWQAERSVPDIDTYALSSYWYARGPELAFDTDVNGHSYGMFLLNAYLDQYLIGLDGIRDIWNDAGPSWNSVIADHAGTDFTTVMHGFVGAYAAGALDESALYDTPLTPLRYSTVPDRAELALPDRYGTVYIELADYDPERGIGITGPVDWVIIQDGSWDVQPESGPLTLAVTATGDGSTFTFGTAEDTGTTDTGSKPSPEPASCGCVSGGGSVSGGGPLSWFVLLGLAALRRRESAATVSAHPQRARAPASPVV